MYYKSMFNDSCSLVFEKIIFFHDKVSYILLFIGFFIFFSLCGVWYNRSLSTYFLEKNFLEILWTLVPVLILLILAFPSLSLLYLIDSPLFKNCLKSKFMKVEGHQWYWSYEYDLGAVNYSYDSFMTPFIDLRLGGLRLLEVDKPLLLGVGEMAVLQGSTGDVMHSWSLPSLGIKFDVVPGRLKSFIFNPVILGSFYGQCSEICGANHSFMPVEVEVIFGGVVV